MKRCPPAISSGKNCRKNEIRRSRMCIPSTSASVAMTTFPYRSPSRPSSMLRADCRRWNSSFSRPPTSRSRDDDLPVPEPVEALLDVEGRLQEVELLVLVDDLLREAVRV